MIRTRSLENSWSEVKNNKNKMIKKNVILLICTETIPKPWLNINNV